MTAPSPDPVARQAAASTRLAERVSGDSGALWSDPGAWPVAVGVHRIPLPLPSDALRAVNVYAVEGGDGLTLIDGGWQVTEAREALEAGLAALGHGLRDIRRFLVTHVHRDHWTLAAAVHRELGTEVHLGLAERPTIEVSARHLAGEQQDNPLAAALHSTGAHAVAEQWERAGMVGQPDHLAAMATPPTHWLDGEAVLDVGGRSLDAVPTPGHTAGHYVFADAAAGVLFAGDHVLPHITPSIGFEPFPPLTALGDFLGSLTRVRAMPDMVLLPAHGPVVPSAHARIDELLAHHEDRLARCLAAVRGAGVTAYDVAGELPWTRRETPFSELDQFNAALAALETRHHLELLAARGDVHRTGGAAGGALVYAPA